MVNVSSADSSILHYTDLEKQIWREIITASDFRLIKEKLKKEAKAASIPMTDGYATQKAKDIQYCINQAKEYFHSSKSVSLVIKPTLIYYGLVSLAAALIIAKNRDKSLNSLKAAHGLKDSYPEKLNNLGSQTISRDALLEISAEIQDSGTFAEIARMDLFENFTMPIKRDGQPDTSKDYRQLTNFKHSYPMLKAVKLSSILQNIPEIWKETKLILKLESLVYMGEAVLNKETVTCRISKELNTTEELKKNLVFAENAHFGESNNFYFFSTLGSLYTGKAPLAKRDIIGSQYLTADKNNPLIASDFVLYYLTFFILGSLARYKPALWRYMLEDQMHGLSTIPDILCESAYCKLPLYFLNTYTNHFHKN